MTRLCTTFQALARHVWNDRADGVRRGLDPSEPTITETLLLKLARAHPNELVIRKFTQREEGRQYGADWEWWFAGSGKVWGMRVQAKKLLRDYQGIDYPHGKRRRQIKVFLDAAARDGLYPIYCFYNMEHPTFREMASECMCIDADSSLFGCAIASGHFVRRMQRAKRWAVEDIAPGSLPWHCAVCCPPNLLRAAGQRVEPADIRDWVQDALEESPRSRSELELPPVRLIEQAPPYVMQMYEGERRRPSGPFEMWEERYRDIAGVVLFRTLRWTE